MQKQGPEFFDDFSVFENYSASRSKVESPNETIEQPILWDLIGDPSGLDVCDLGCGEARTIKRFWSLGAKSYVGVDGSKKMLERAKRNGVPGFSRLVYSWLENYEPDTSAYDLVISSLALHYIADIGKVFAGVSQSLRPGGRFIFSLEHPVITSCSRSLENSSLRQDWIVDDYFKRGLRRVEWMGGCVLKYHRTIEDLLNELICAGFALKDLRESDPPSAFFTDENLLARRQRIPLFLFLAAEKKYL